MRQLIVIFHLRGELFYVDLEKSLEETSDTAKWNPFVSLPGENQHHRKAIFDILCYKNKIITLSLDRLVSLFADGCFIFIISN